jgi:hypothetical protein
LPVKRLVEPVTPLIELMKRLCKRVMLMPGGRDPALAWGFDLDEHWVEEDAVRCDPEGVWNPFGRPSKRRLRDQR